MDIDVRIVIAKFLRKWPVFLISLLVSIGIALLYLNATEKKYLVEASVQLKDQSLSEKNTSKEKFINGFVLLESDAELEDEIGKLSSFSTIQKAVAQVNTYTDLYRYHSNKDIVGKFFSREVYKEEFTIELDLTKGQLVDVPITISFSDKNNFTLEIEADLADVYDYSRQSIARKRSDISVKLKGKVGVPFSSPYVSFTLKPISDASNYWSNQYYFVNHTLTDIAESYQKRLKIAPLGEKSNIVDLSLQGSVPAKDMLFLNTLMAVYIDNDLHKRNQLGLNTIDFIDKQINKVADTLQRVENSMQDFRAESKVIDINTTSQTLTDLLNQLEEKQIERKSQNEYYQYLADYLNKDGALTDMVTPSAVGISDLTLNKLLDDFATLNREKVSIEYNSQGNLNPVLKVKEQKIAQAKKAISDNIKNLVRSSQFALQQNQARINSVKENINRLPKNEKDLNNINRKFELNDNVYKYLLEKRAEASIVVASNVPDKDVVDPARQIGKKPVAPNKLMILLTSCFLGLVFPIGFISIKDYFSRVVESEEQLEKNTPIPVLTTVAYTKRDKKQSPHETDYYVENAFKATRQYLQTKNYRVIGVTSLSSSEGKTFCALHLANSFARGGHKTLLIDTDFYESGLSKLFHMENISGLADCLADEETPVVQQTAFKNLDVLAAGNYVEHRQEDLLADHRFRSLLTKLVSDYAYIIVDTSPVGVISDYLAFANELSFTLFVVRDNFTRLDYLKNLNKIIVNNSLVSKVGIVYNGVKASKNYYNYYRKLVS